MEASTMPGMNELVEYMAKSLVNNPEAVVVREIEGASSTVFELSVAPEDMGRVIGKQGRVANAMRTLLRVAAIKDGKRVTLEIV
jgi:predicted RNA-binding protein YlqC (UPF0109 family)